MSDVETASTRTFDLQQFGQQVVRAYRAAAGRDSGFSGTVQVAATRAAEIRSEPNGDLTISPELAADLRALYEPTAARATRGDYSGPKRAVQTVIGELNRLAQDDRDPAATGPAALDGPALQIIDNALTDRYAQELESNFTDHLGLDPAVRAGLAEAPVRSRGYEPFVDGYLRDVISDHDQRAAVLRVASQSPPQHQTLVLAEALIAQTALAEVVDSAEVDRVRDQVESSLLRNAEMSSLSLKAGFGSQPPAREAGEAVARETTTIVSNHMAIALNRGALTNQVAGAAVKYAKAELAAAEQLAGGADPAEVRTRLSAAATEFTGTQYTALQNLQQLTEAGGQMEAQIAGASLNHRMNQRQRVAHQFDNPNAHSPSRADLDAKLDALSAAIHQDQATLVQVSQHAAVATAHLEAAASQLEPLRDDPGLPATLDPAELRSSGDQRRTAAVAASRGVGADAGGQRQDWSSSPWLAGPVAYPVAAGKAARQPQLARSTAQASAVDGVPRLARVAKPEAATSGQSQSQRPLQLVAGRGRRPGVGSTRVVRPGESRRGDGANR